MAIAWLVRFGDAFCQQFERSRLFQLFSLVCGFVAFCSVLLAVIAKTMNGLIALFMFNPLSDVSWMEWLLEGAGIGVVFGIFAFFHKIALERPASRP